MAATSAPDTGAPSWRMSPQIPLSPASARVHRHGRHQPAAHELRNELVQIALHVSLGSVILCHQRPEDLVEPLPRLHELPDPRPDRCQPEVEDGAYGQNHRLAVHDPEHDVVCEAKMRSLLGLGHLATLSE